jgi:hypothetical protein
MPDFFLLFLSYANVLRILLDGLTYILLLILDYLRYIDLRSHQ